MKSKMNGMVLTVLAASLLAACGGGGGSTPAANNTTPPPGNTTPPPGAPAAGTPTASTASALTAIQTQLNAFQGRFATTMPLATDPVLVAMLDATFMDDGSNAAAFLATQTTLPMNGMSMGGFPIGATFSAPIGANPPDAGSVANDATHQWFATSINGGNNGGYIQSVQYVRMLAIKNGAGQWLLAGNQRQVTVYVGSYAQQYILAPVAVGVAVTPMFSTGINLFANTAGSMATVTSATVSGPGLIGATAGVAGAVNLAVTPFVQPCGIPQFSPVGTPAVTTNCMDLTKATAGTYSFNLVGATNAGAALNATYNEPFVAVPPAAPTAANFPVINSVAPASLAALIPGAALSVNWTARAGQTPKEVSVFATSAPTVALPGGALLFSLNLPVVGAAAGTTLTSSGFVPATPFTVGATVGSVNVTVGATDANGLMFTTTQDY